MCADRHNTGDVRKASRLEGRIEVTSNRQSGVDVILIAIENRALQISFEIKKDQSAQTIFNKIRGIMPYRLLGDKDILFCNLVRIPLHARRTFPVRFHA